MRTITFYMQGGHVFSVDRTPEQADAITAALAGPPTVLWFNSGALRIMTVHVVAATDHPKAA